MRIHFRKNSAREFTLHCIRADGTETWRKYKAGDFQLEHDLMHLAVETMLGFSHAFYGLLGSGCGIEWFEHPADEASRKKPSLPTDALQAEIIVGLLQTLRNDGDFLENLPTVVSQFNLPMPAITREQISNTRAQVRDWVTQWNQSPDGIMLDFENCAQSGFNATLGG